MRTYTCGCTYFLKFPVDVVSPCPVSFEMSEYTADADGLGTLRLLNAIRTCGLQDTCRFYQVWRLDRTLDCTLDCTLDRALDPRTGVDQRAVRPGARGAPEGVDAFLSSVPVRRCEAICILDDRKLPRSLLHVCSQRHLVQP